MKLFLPLLILHLVDILRANHRSSCNFCRNICSSTASSYSALCKCDADCQVFGDCCGASTPPNSCPASQLSPLPDGVMLDCISTYLNPNILVLADKEAFLMVSTCPHSWIETENGIIAENCISPNSATTLPPMTNTITGIVYRNEYCAICNGVRELIAWQTNLVCNPAIYQLLVQQSITDILLSEPDILRRECQACSFHIPTVMTTETTSQTMTQHNGYKAPRSCIPSKNMCLSQMLLETKIHRILQNETYALMEQECVSGVIDHVRVTSSGVLYRNKQCAACNAVNKDDRQCYTLAKRDEIPALCFPPITDLTATTITSTTATTAADTIPTTDSNPTNFTVMSRIIEKIDPPIVPSIFFTITLSNLGGGMVSISTMSESANISLNCPEGTAPVGMECRPTQCPEGYTETGGRCSYNMPLPPNLHRGLNFTMENCTSGILVLNETDYFDLGNDTVILADDKSVVGVMDYDEFGRPLICITKMFFLDCLTALVPLNESDYTHLGNNSLVYKNEIFEVMFYDKLGRPLICPENITSPKLTIITSQILATLLGLQELTYIGCSLSLLGTTLILLTYSLFRELRTLPGLILMNLSSTILAIDIIFIAGNIAIQSYPVKELCSSLAIVLHFSYLSQFAWMSIFICEMVRNFYKARQLLTDSSKTKHQLIVAYLCIGWCLPLLVIAITITLNFSVDGAVLYGADKDETKYLCWINHYTSFIITFLIPLVLSLSCNLLMLSLTTYLLCIASRDQSKLQRSNTFTLIRVWLAIFSTTGLTWIFGFVAILDQLNWVWYPFVIFNSTQGLAMFLAFLFSKKALRLYLDLFTCKKLKKYILSSINARKVSLSKIGLSKVVTTTSSSNKSADILGGDSVVTVATNNSGNNTVKESGVEALSKC